jgi:hypothetical protein
MTLRSDVNQHACDDEREPVHQAKDYRQLHRLPDDIDYDRAIEGIYVLQRYEIAQDQIRRGEVFDDDKVLQQHVTLERCLMQEVGALRHFAMPGLRLFMNRGGMTSSNVLASITSSMMIVSGTSIVARIKPS